MTELEKLIEQRNEISKRIRELQTNQVVFGMVRMTHEERRGGFFKVSSLVDSLSGDDVNNTKRWMPMICGRNKEQVDSKIRVIITDLNKLLEYLEKGEE